MVGLGRVELPTSPLSGVRSSQLSYRPVWDPLFEKLKDPEARGWSPRNSSIIKNFFEDRLNVHPGLAGTDHHENRARKRCPNGTPSSSSGNSKDSGYAVNSLLESKVTARSLLERR